MPVHLCEIKRNELNLWSTVCKPQLSLTSHLIMFIAGNNLSYERTDPGANIYLLACILHPLRGLPPWRGGGALRTRMICNLEVRSQVKEQTKYGKNNHTTRHQC